MTQCIICGCSNEYDIYGDRICFCDTCCYNNTCCYPVCNEICDNDVIRTNIKSFINKNKKKYGNLYCLVFDLNDETKKMLEEYENVLKNNKQYIELVDKNIYNGVTVYYLVFKSYLIPKNTSSIYLNCECKKLSHSCYDYTEDCAIIFGKNGYINFVITGNDISPKSKIPTPCDVIRNKHPNVDYDRYIINS